MSKPIDLGKSLSDMISVSELSPDKKHYPDLCIDTDDKDLAQMPDKGQATIRYRVVSRTHREENKGKGNGKEYSCSLRLEVISMEPPAAKSEPRKNSNDEARKAFENHRDAFEK